MADVVYKLPLDPETDKDLIEWINSFPRNKKAEVVRHALRYYKSNLKEGEAFIMPTAHTAPSPSIKEETKPVRPKVGIRTNKSPISGLGDRLKNPE